MHKTTSGSFSKIPNSFVTTMGHSNLAVARLRTASPRWDGEQPAQPCSHRSRWALSHTVTTDFTRCHPRLYWQTLQVSCTERFLTRDRVASVGPIATCLIAWRHRPPLWFRLRRPLTARSGWEHRIEGSSSWTEAAFQSHRMS